MAEKNEARLALEARAKELGVEFNAKIGDEKLQARVDAAGEGGAGSSAIRVTGPKKGRWRIGRHFTREATIIPRDELSDAEFAALEADDKLSVSEITLADPASGD